MQTFKVQKGQYFKTNFASMIVLTDMNGNQNEKKRSACLTTSGKMDQPTSFWETLVYKSAVITGHHNYFKSQ